MPSARSPRARRAEQPGLLEVERCRHADGYKLFSDLGYTKQTNFLWGEKTEVEYRLRVGGW